MILFVDDEPRYIDSYVWELREAGFDLSQHTTVDSAVDFFDRNQNQVRLLILDIMMPPGAAFAATDTKRGSRTGLSFYEYVRERAPTLPVFILTNISSDDVRQRFHGEDNCWFFQKYQCLPFELAERAKEIVAPHSRRVKVVFRDASGEEQ